MLKNNKRIVHKNERNSIKGNKYKEMEKIEEIFISFDKKIMKDHIILIAQIKK